jgi:DNA-binding CsgD family transcriptional regulator
MTGVPPRSTRRSGLWHDKRVGGETVSSALESARAALDRGEFAEARQLFEAVLAEGAGAEALDGLGQALWFTCDIDSAIARREEAFVEYRRAGEIARAAEIALWLYVEHAFTFGNEAAAGGWLKRAERLLADVPLCPAHAELEVRLGQRCGDPSDAQRHYERAVEIGRELGDFDSEIRGLNQLGFLKVTLGDVEGGMALLDETMAAALSGEIRDPWAIGSTCCSMMFACERISDLQRAAQWCEVVLAFTVRRRFVPFSPLCRSIYAAVFTARGEWRRAEEELLAAAAAYRGFGKGLAAFPLARLADLRLRQGRLEEAERLIAGWEGHPEMRLVGLALLIECGETGAARARLLHELQRLGDESPLAAGLLELLVRVHVAEGDLDAAQAAAARFLRLARALGHAHLVGRARLAAGEAGGPSAVQHLEGAAETFLRLGMPLEEARARLALARAFAHGEHELAVSEARGALEVFERLGAGRHADEAAHVLRDVGAPERRAPKRPGELTKRAREVLDLLERGLSNKEIAARLFITPKTAAHHVSRILFKLDARTRAEAAAYAARARTEQSVAK